MNELSTRIDLTLNQKVTGQDVAAVLDKTADGAERVESTLKSKDRIIASFMRNITTLLSAQVKNVGQYEKGITAALQSAIPLFNVEAQTQAQKNQVVAAAVRTYQGYIKSLYGAGGAGKLLASTQEKLGGEFLKTYTLLQALTTEEKVDVKAKESQAQVTNKLSSATKALTSSVKDTSVKMHSLRASMGPLLGIIASMARGMNGLRASFSSVFGVLSRGYSAFRRLFHVGQKWFDLSTQFAEVNHLLYTSLVNLFTGFHGVTASVKGSADALSHYNVELQDVLGRDLDKVISFEDKGAADAIRDASKALQEYSYRMMLDPTNVTKTYASFLEMADASKMVGDYAVALSQDMTQLTFDMASLWDIPFEDSATKLRSALSGITRAIRAQGVDVGRAAADAWLAKKGIDAVYNSLSLGDKMLVQFNLAIEGAVAAQGDLAASVLQPANLFRILKEQVTQTARAFGAALFPMLTAIIPLLIVAAEAARRFATMLANFLGRKLGKIYTDSADMWSAYADNFKDRSGVKVLEQYAENADDIGDGLSSAGKAAKDFKKQLLGFDEINNLTETEKGTGGIGGGLGDTPLDFSGLIGIPNYAEIVGDVRTQIYGKAAELKRELVKLFDTKFGEGAFDSMIASLKRFKESIFGVKRESSIWDTQRKKVFSLRGELDEIPTVVDRTGTVVERLSSQWGRFKNLIGATDAPKFFDNFLQGVLNGINGIQNLIDRLLDFGERLKEIFGNRENSESFATILGKIVTYFAALTALSPLLTPVTNAISTIAMAGSQGLMGAGAIADISNASGGKKSTGSAKTPKESIFTRISEKIPGGDRAKAIGKSGKSLPGLSSAELAGKSSSEMFAAISKAAATPTPITTGEKMASVFGKLGDASDLLKGKIVGLGEAFKGMSAFGKFNVILTIVTVFIEMVRNSEALQSALSSLWDAVKSVLEVLLPLFDALNTALAPVFKILGDLFAGLLQPIIWFLTDIVVPVITKITEGLNWLIGLFTGTAETGVESSSQMSASLKGAFEDIDWEALLGEIWTIISEWFGTLWNDLVVWLGDIWNSISAWFGGLWTDFTTWLGGIWTNISNWYTGLMTDIGLWLLGIWNSIKDWFLGLPTSIKERIDSLWESITSNVKAFLKDPIGWGRDILIGLWNGINEKVQWIKDKVSGAFSAIGNTVKKIFGIASPSKLMMEYGGYVSEGFEIGIENGIPSILETVNALSTDVATLMENGVVGLGAIATAEMDNLNATLATGVTASAQSTLDTNNNDMVGTMQMEIGLLREQNNLLSQILGKDVSVSLDGKQIAASINQASRIQGRPLIYA